MKPSILIIDDKEDLLADLVTALKAQLPEDEVEIRSWIPTNADHDPRTAFKAHIDAGTVLVVADYDLTARGQTGLFGSTIVAWCQARGLPVGDFSRNNVGHLPKEPNLFEVRVPSEIEKAGPFISRVYRGFRDVRKAIDEKAQILSKKRSPAAVLAQILDMPTAENQFALYSVRLAATSGDLMERVAGKAPAKNGSSGEEKKALLAYIVGHLLLNSILRFAGPILSATALMAYVGTDDSEVVAVSPHFTAARYSGPFSELDDFFWLFRVDQVLREFAKDLPTGFTAETPGGFNRELLRLKLNRELNRHGCPRCGGVNGGFLCPFTNRTVCQRSDCSAGSNSWIPQGASLCRIEREYYDEWAPILGI